MKLKQALSPEAVSSRSFLAHRNTAGPDLMCLLGGSWVVICGVIGRVPVKGC